MFEATESSTGPHHNCAMDKPQTHDFSISGSDAAAAEIASGSVMLTHWSLIRATGSDAATFLHGQLTNGFSDLGPQRIQLAGFCSAKGRLQASFVGWRSGADEFLLACHASVLTATLKRLSMFVLRSKCKLADATSTASDDAAAGSRLTCTGLIGSAADAALAAAGLDAASTWQHRSVADGQLIHLPPVAGFSRAVWVARAGLPAPGSASRPADASDTSDTGTTLDQWRWLEVQSGIPMIVAETADQFVPQMINFELVGGVDFQKGCYPGQEIVARSQYRGTVKRRMFLFNGAAVCTPGQDVYHSSDAGQPAGMVVNRAPRPTGSGDSALIEVKLAALDEGSLHLDSVDGPLLSRVDLPYAVTAASET